MLVKYRMVSGATVADLQSDIHKIISGAISTVSDFSNSCDKTNTLIFGTYPTGKYAVQDAGTYTYSKVHSQYPGTTHYFRLNWGASGLDTVNLAQSYTAGTNTLVNSTTSNIWRLAYEFSTVTLNNPYTSTHVTSDGTKTIVVANAAIGTVSVGDLIKNNGEVLINSSSTSLYSVADRFERNSIITSILAATANTQTICTMNWDYSTRPKTPTGTLWGIYRGSNVNLTTWPYASPTYNTMDISITDKGIFFGSAVNGVAFGIFDLSKNGLTREFTSSSLMAMVDLNNFNNGVQIPYWYNVSTSSYGVVAAGMNYETPTRIPRANATQYIVENPVSTTHRSAGFSVSTFYGFYKIANGTYNNSSRYTDGSGVNRIVYNNFCIVTE